MNDDCFSQKVTSCLAIAAAGGIAFAGANICKGNEKFYANLLMPAAHLLIDGEHSHRLAITLARHGLVPRAADLSEDKHLLVSRYSVHKTASCSLLLVTGNNRVWDTL